MPMVEQIMAGNTKGQYPLEGLPRAKSRGAANQAMLEMIKVKIGGTRCKILPVRRPQRQPLMAMGAYQAASLTPVTPYARSRWPVVVKSHEPKLP